MKNTEMETSVHIRWMSPCRVTVLVALLMTSPSHSATASIGVPQSYASFALEESDFSQGGVVYQPRVEPSDWSGEVLKWHFTRSGDSKSREWSARSVLADKVARDTDYWKQRRIVTADGDGNQVDFLWNRLDSNQRKMLGLLHAESNGPYASPVLNYLRGDKSAESWTQFRRRGSIIGDIMHSTPHYVGAPGNDSKALPYNGPGYKAFLEKHAARPGRLYVGANDGMLHALDAENGEEVFAYIPSMVDFSKLATLPQQGYGHQAFVDGAPVSANVETDRGWRTLLAGGLGAGGKGLFLLDITEAGSSDKALEELIQAELSGADRDMGHVHGSPTFAMLEDGNWYLVSGNGIGSESGEGVLFMLPLGSLDKSRSARKVTVPDAYSGGLSSPALIDMNGNGKADTAYAGDLAGNLWRFDLADFTVEPDLVFKAGYGRPIRLRPEVARHPMAGYLVYVATGGGDLSEDAHSVRQGVFAIHDKPGRDAVIRPGDLENLSPALRNFREHGRRFRLLDGESHSSGGWRLDLPEAGETILERPVLHAGRLRFVSAYPEPAGAESHTANWYMEIDWLTGGSANRATVDINEDGLLNEKDAVIRDGRKFFPIGEYLGRGAYSGIRVVHLEPGMDGILINGTDLKPTNGLAGSHHFDLDILSPSGLSGGKPVESHLEAYDKRSPASASVDFFSLKSESLQPLLPRSSGDFLILMANADLSPAGDIHIANNKEKRVWSLMGYQQRIQRLIESYRHGSDPHTHFVDETGFPLIFTSASGSTFNRLEKLSIHFDPYAVEKGAMHGTLPRCIDRNGEAVNGRWRNGALTMQLFDISQLDAEGALKIQKPADLAPYAKGYGGVIKASAHEKGLLYESAIHWHYPGKACYGESGWGESILKHAGALTSAVLYELLSNKSDFTSATITEVVGNLEELSGYVCEDGTVEECREESAYRDLIDELEGYLETGLIEEALLQHGILQTSLHESVGTMHSASDLQQLLKPKQPARARNVDRRWSWTDLEK